MPPLRVGGELPPRIHPFFPTDLVARLVERVRREQAELGCAASNGRTHPVFGLWPVALAPSLREALTIEGMREIGAWTARHCVATVEFPSESYDAFFNVNTPQDLEEAEMLLALGSRRALPFADAFSLPWRLVLRRGRVS